MKIDAVLSELGNQSRIVSLITKTEPETRKTNENGEPKPFVTLVRIARRRGMIGISYESCVNRQRNREEQPLDDEGNVEYFHAEGLWNGLGEHDGPLTVRHKIKGTRYICFRPMNEDNDSVVIDEDLWLADGSPVEKRDVEPWLKGGGKSRRQQVDKQVFWRTIALENIVEIKTGEIYSVNP